MDKHSLGGKICEIFSQENPREGGAKFPICPFWLNHGLQPHQTTSRIQDLKKESRNDLGVCNEAPIGLAHVVACTRYDNVFIVF